VSEQDNLSSRDIADTQRIPPGGTPGYTTLNLRSEWQVRNGLVLSVALDNLTDEEYRVHGSGVNEPGRNLIASLSWTL
jgi:hemoglobin/transferrin/lactoferrin receptor protein